MDLARKSSASISFERPKIAPGRCFTTLWRDKLGQISLAITTLFWGAGATRQFIVLAWATQALFLLTAVLVPFLIARVPLGRFWQCAREPFLIAFGTTSSAADVYVECSGAEALIANTPNPLQPS